MQGHTDDVGSRARNQLLSVVRAQVIANAIGKRGVEQKRLIIRGFGQSVPLAANDDSEQRQHNRRVEFKIVRRRK